MYSTSYAIIIPFWYAGGTSPHVTLTWVDDMLTAATLIGALAGPTSQCKIKRTTIYLVMM